MRQDSLLAGRAQCMYSISSTHTRTCKTTSTLVHASVILHLKIWYQLSNRFTHPTWVRSRRGRICDIQLYYHVVLGLLLPLYLNVSLHLPLSLSLSLSLSLPFSLSFLVTHTVNVPSLSFPLSHALTCSPSHLLGCSVFRPHDLEFGEVLGEGFFGRAVKVSSRRLLYSIIMGRHCG